MRPAKTTKQAWASLGIISVQSMMETDTCTAALHLPRDCALKEGCICLRSSAGTLHEVMITAQTCACPLLKVTVQNKAVSTAQTNREDFRIS